MKGFIVLETGEVFPGVAHNEFERAGEVVFNTSHSGYEEIATDPSYFSQIVVMTAPMQGNYGVDNKVWESRKFFIEGFISLELQDSARETAWKKRLQEQGVSCLSEVDTRALVLRLRSGGTPWGAIVRADSSEQALEKAKKLIAEKRQSETDWVHLVSRKHAEVRKGEQPEGPRIAVLDFGTKENILRELSTRCSEIKIFNSRASAAEISEFKPDGLMLTNGPGDPAEVKVAQETVQKFLGRTPVFGICMGHQVLALALGAKTYKMKFGHRGSNHPIKDTLLNQVYMTSQNHGYAVDEKSLPSEALVTQKNLNDNTVAGFYCREKKYLGIQFHPESRPGPHESSVLFDHFVHTMIGSEE